MEENKFSIIMPVYNGEKVLRRSLNSIMNIDYSNWELIVINDGSNDKTKEIFKDYEMDPRIKIINKENEGVSVARNVGISVATGDYIIFVDADDYVEPCICKVLIEKIKNSDFVISAYYIINLKKEIANVPEECDKCFYDINSFSNYFGLLYERGLLNSPWSKCYKRKLITKKFEPGINLGEDILFNLSYLINCKKISLNLTPVYNYIVNNGGSLSSGVVKNGFETLTYVYRETKNKLRFMFDDISGLQPYIERKYLMDMMVMIERYIIQHINHYFKLKDVESVINKYDIIQKCIDNKLKDNIKWRLARWMISKGRIKVFYYYIKIIYLVKMKGVNFRYVAENKSKNKRNY